MRKIKVGTNYRIEGKYQRWLKKRVDSAYQIFKSKLVLDNEIYDLQKIYDLLKENIDNMQKKDVERLLYILLEQMIAEIEKAFKISDPTIFKEKDKIIITQFVENNVNLIASLMDDIKKKTGVIIGNAIVEGKTIKDISSELQKVIDTGHSSAERIAITETSRANSQFARTRFKEYGVTMLEWSSAHDKRTRKCHLARDGKEYELEKGCYSGCDGRYLQTGQEVRCRCAMVGILSNPPDIF